MTGKRSIKVHGERIAAGRAAAKLDQESFARSAEVSVRTLQRAEKSGMISPSKIRQIAGVLNVNPEELICDEPLATSSYGPLILKPMRSYKDLQQLSLSYFPISLDLDYKINPQPDFIEKVAAVIKVIQKEIKFFSDENPPPYDLPDYAERFKRDMAFTQNLVDLWEGGISVFAGHYIHRRLLWLPDNLDTNSWHPFERSCAALRFFDDKSVAQNNQISERVYYGLSKSTIQKWAFSKQKNIRQDGSTIREINANDQIETDSDDEIPFY